MLDSSERKFRNFTAVSITIFALMFVVSLSIVGSIFYNKYQASVAKSTVALDKRADFILEQYIWQLERVGRYDEEFFQNFINNNVFGDVVLLKDNGKNGYKVVASTDKNVKINSDYESESCGNIEKHDFSRELFFKKILPENSALVCIYKKSGEYIVGMKTILTHSISGFDDEDFWPWLLANLKTSIIATSFGTLFSIIAFFWFMMRYSTIRRKYDALKQSNEQRISELDSQLYIDNITKLPNKIALTRDMAHLKSPKVILIDIDDFSKMNDFYGKDVCDEILAQMANLIDEFGKSENMRVYCLAADRFALVEDGEFFIDRYEELMDELLGRFKGRVLEINANVGGEEINEIEVHTTIGFALDADHTLQKAAVALKAAKNSHKDFVAYFKGLSQNDEYEDQVVRSKMIQKAVINSNVVPYYQPIFNADGDIVKYECLIRLVDLNDIVSPHQFLAISKRIKRYAELEKLLITKGIEQVAMTPNLTLSINLSGRDMTDGDVSALVLRMLNKHKVADRIVFEIVEDEDVESVERVSAFIERVKSMGAKIAIDDFGSGYSNFSYILKLRPDFIKIDGSIIKDIDINKDSYAIARAIVAFARDLGIKTIAEYVHSKEIFTICKEIGIDEFQGFYLGVPSDKIL